MLNINNLKRDSALLNAYNSLSSGNGCVPPGVLLVLVNEHLLKDNLALDFVLEVFATVKAERGVASLVTALKKGQLEGRSAIT